MSTELFSGRALRATLCAVMLPMMFVAVGCSKEKGEAPAAPAANAATAKEASVMGKVAPKANDTLQKPFYPPEARSRGEQGVVQLNLHVLADGRVDDATVIKSSDFPQLDEYAVRGVRSWKLTPGTVDGKPTTMWHPFRVTYKLD